jgi:MHS family proline/betaine transporter-like MFS transporter
MTSTSRAEATGTGGSSVTRATTAAAIGTFVEYYDFVVYAYLATVIGPLFFPGASPVAGLLLTFGAFATSYIVRPLGAMIFGSFGDRYGRRKVLSWVLLLMAAATTLIGVLPTYAQVGALAPVLLTLVRVLQGLSMGGEFGGASTYVAEYAPPSRRGLYMSWLAVAIGLGSLAGASGVGVLGSVMSAEALSSWGWRVPFLLALPLGLVGLYLRLRLEETPQFTSAAKRDEIVDRPLRASLRGDLANILLVVGLIASSTVAVYLFLIYAPSYMTRILGYSPGPTQAATTVGLAAYCVVGPFFGALTDRVGRKPVLMTAAGLIAVLSYPGFVLFGTGDIVVALVVMVVMALLSAAAVAAMLPLLPELFATATRFTSLGIGWNISAVVFGGAAPLIATSLIAGTGNTAAPGLFAALGGAVTVLALLFVRKARPGEPDRSL